MKRKSSEEPAAAEEEKKKKKKMAPALLLAESSVKGDTAAKSKTKKRPQPDDREPTASHEKEAERTTTPPPPHAELDLAALEARVAAEDVFICGLLDRLPKSALYAGDDAEDDADAEEGDGEKPAAVERATDAEELKKRLAAKLAEFQGKRKLDFSEKKMKTKLSKRLERLEKRKLNKRKSRQTKSKMARLARETQQHEQQQQQQQEETIKSEPSVVEVPNRPPKPVFNSEGRMVFSKFDFGGLTAPTSSSMLSATRTKSNDPKAALRKLHKVHQTLERLEADGRTEQAHQITEQRAWDGAIQRSEGVKVKDSEELLLKTIKRKEQKKKQSKKKWEERTQAVEKRKEDAQKKRRANIKARKDTVKENKLNRMAKRGKIILK